MQNPLTLFLWRVWNAPPLRCGYLVVCDQCGNPFRCTVPLQGIHAHHTHKGWAFGASSDHLKGVHFNVQKTFRSVW